MHGVVEITEISLSNGYDWSNSYPGSLTGRTFRHWRVWSVKLSSPTLGLGCKKSVRFGYVIALVFTKCRGVRLLARFLNYYVLGCKNFRPGGLGTTWGSKDR